MVAIVERTQIYLTEQQQRELERRVISTGRTKSDLIREALDAFLGTEETNEEWRRRWVAAVDAVAGIATYLPDADTYTEELRRADREQAGRARGTPARMSYVLDSTVLIDVLRDDPDAIAFLRSVQERPTASEVTRIEILRGLRAPERALVERLFLLLDWHPVDESVARVAGEFGRRFRRSHVGLGMADLIVAATAQHLGMPLATANTKHFPMFPRLKAPY